VVDRESYYHDEIPRDSIRESPSRDSERVALMSLNLPPLSKRTHAHAHAPVKKITSQNVWPRINAN